MDKISCNLKQTRLLQLVHHCLNNLLIEAPCMILIRHYTFAAAFSQKLCKRHWLSGWNFHVTSGRFHITIVHSIYICDIIGWSEFFVTLKPTAPWQRSHRMWQNHGDWKQSSCWKWTTMTSPWGPRLEVSSSYCCKCKLHFFALIYKPQPYPGAYFFKVFKDMYNMCNVKGLASTSSED